VAIIHHTDCGSTLLADDDMRHGFAQRVGVDERTLADTPVLDPARTVRTDVNRVLWAEEIPENVRVSGHVYDVDTGLVTTIVGAKGRQEQQVTSRFSAA
jgi:carbonic anhydrase